MPLLEAYHDAFSKKHHTVPPFFSVPVIFFIIIKRG